MHKYNLNDFLSRQDYEQSDKEIIEFLFKEFGSTKFFIAGGALKSLLMNAKHSSDYDIFCDNASVLEELKTQVEKLGGKLVKSTDLHHTYSFPYQEKQLVLQLIKIYGPPESIIDSFDFTICQLITNGDSLWVGPYTLWDLAWKRLVIHKITYGASTLRRFIKYTKQGFYACQGAMVQFLTEIASNPQLIQEEIKYVD